jgi:hypothetical protein
MNSRFLRRFAYTVLIALALAAAGVQARERVFVLTDISNEPDDEQSMVRFLVYSNEYDVEGLVATTSVHLRTGPREDLIRRQLAAYGEVRPNLQHHAAGFPELAALEKVTATGQPEYGMSAVGEGKSSAGSRLLIEAVDKTDERPLWVSVWGGANTLAQALYDVRSTRSPDELASFVSRLRVYTISDQDDAGHWLRREFPDLYYIVSPSTTQGREYYRATWTGIAGDRFYKNGPGLDFELVENSWLRENVMQGHGPLGALYPEVAYIMEGDTPSYLGLIDNGLGWSESPAYGGWGGRYVSHQGYGETREIWTDDMLSRDTVDVQGVPYTSNQATIWRWRRDFQHDFAARMDWCVADELSGANHNPVAILNDDATTDVLRLQATPGSRLTLSSRGSDDPDGDAIKSRWMIYHEAGLFSGAATLSRDVGVETELVIPAREVGVGSTIHVVLVVEDSGSPSLVSYRRAIVEVVAPAGASGYSTVTSTLGELVDDPRALAVLERHLPMVSHNRAALAQVRSLTLVSIKSFMPGLTDDVLRQIDDDLAEIDRTQTP